MMSRRKEASIHSPPPSERVHDPQERDSDSGHSFLPASSDSSEQHLARKAHHEKTHRHKHKHRHSSPRFIDIGSVRYVREIQHEDSDRPPDDTKHRRRSTHDDEKHKKRHHHHHHRHRDSHDSRRGSEPSHHDKDSSQHARRPSNPKHIRHTEKDQERTGKTLENHRQGISPKHRHAKMEVEATQVIADHVNASETKDISPTTRSSEPKDANSKRTKKQPKMETSSGKPSGINTHAIEEESSLLGTATAAELSEPIQRDPMNKPSAPSDSGDDPSSMSSAVNRLGISKVGSGTWNSPVTALSGNLDEDMQQVVPSTDRVEANEPNKRRKSCCTIQ